MRLLPIELINHILSYREIHPAAKLIKNYINGYKKIEENLKKCMYGDFCTYENLVRAHRDMRNYEMKYVHHLLLLNALYMQY